MYTCRSKSNYTFRGKRPMKTLSSPMLLLLHQECRCHNANKEIYTHKITHTHTDTHTYMYVCVQGSTCPRNEILYFGLYKYHFIFLHTVAKARQKILFVGKVSLRDGSIQVRWQIISLFENPKTIQVGSSKERYVRYIFEAQLTNGVHSGT